MSSKTVAIRWRKGDRRCLASSLAIVCRDLERRELLDATAIHSLTRCVSEFVQKTHDPVEQFLQKTRRSVDQGFKCGKHLLAGALSATVCKSVVAPIERVRMDIVLSNTPYGPPRACLEILRNEGISGFWRGNVLNIIRTAPFKAVNFFAFDAYCKLFVGFSDREETGNVERFAAGAMAGITALMACIPLDTIRTRMLSTQSAHQYRNVFHAFHKIIRVEGFSALYKGCIPGILSIAPGSAVFYGVYGTLKQAHLRQEGGIQEEEYLGGKRMELPVGLSLLFGAIAGTCSELVVYPLEVVRRQVQLQTTSMTAKNSAVVARRLGPSLQSISFVCSNIIKTHGIGGFYAGCLLNMVQVLPGAALSYFTYEVFKALLDVEQRHPIKASRTN